MFVHQGNILNLIKAYVLVENQFFEKSFNLNYSTKKFEHTTRVDFIQEAKKSGYLAIKIRNTGWYII